MFCWLSLWRLWRPNTCWLSKALQIKLTGLNKDNLVHRADNNKGTLSAMGCSSSTESGPPESTRPQGRGHPNGNLKNNASDEIAVKPVKVDKDVLLRYINLEQEINRWEKKNVSKSLQTTKDELANVLKSLQALTAKHQECIKQTQKEKADIDRMKNPSVKGFFKSQVQYDTQFSKEQQEYLEALNQEEVVKKELEGETKIKEKLESELQVLEKDNQEYEELHREQDELLAGIFDGSYGSELEDKLERELDAMLDRKQRISVAKFKWQGARVLLQYANNQLAFSVRRWQELGNVSMQQTNQRYTMATEVRNNLIAANQNITSAQRYLHTIQFPYCKADELATLSKATNNIYSDMMSPDRHKHAQECFTVTHKRAAALLQWFDHVINKTITGDLEEVTKMVQQKQKMLRAERLRLIKEKIKETHGDSADLDIENEMDIGDENEAEAESEMNAMAQEPDKVSNAGDVAPPPNDDEPAPLSDSELAPLPSNDDIFGNIDDLKRQHEKEMGEFQKAQETNKARMQQGLQDKLSRRRSRRKRQEIQDAN